MTRTYEFTLRSVTTRTFRVEVDDEGDTHRAVQLATAFALNAFAHLPSAVRSETIEGNIQRRLIGTPTPAHRR